MEDAIELYCFLSASTIIFWGSFCLPVSTVVNLKTNTMFKIVYHILLTINIYCLIDPMQRITHSLLLATCNLLWNKIIWLLNKKKINYWSHDIKSVLYRVLTWNSKIWKQKCENFDNRTLKRLDSQPITIRFAFINFLIQYFDHYV